MRKGVKEAYYSDQKIVIYAISETHIQFIMFVTKQTIDTAKLCIKYVVLL